MGVEFVADRQFWGDVAGWAGTVLGSGLVTLLLGYLINKRFKLLDKAVAKELEEHRKELERALELQRADLARNLETHKLELLNEATLFSAFNKQRSESVTCLSAHLAECTKAYRRHVKAILEGLPTDVTDDLASQWQEKLSGAEDYFDTRELFFSEKVGPAFVRYIYMLEAAIDKARTLVPDQTGRRSAYDEEYSYEEELTRQRSRLERALRADLLQVPEDQIGTRDL